MFINYKKITFSFILLYLFLTTANAKITFGVAQSDFIWHLNDTRYPAALMINDMSKDGVKSIRTNIRGTGTASQFAEIVLQANQNKIDIVAAILQDPDDYTKPLSALDYGDTSSNFTNLCGWQGGTLKFSRLNLGLYEARLKTHLDALKAAGATVTAFEIGNELDWVCFNGDIVFDEAMSADSSKLRAFSEKYAQVLKKSYQMIKQTFPESKVITYGAASCSLFFGKSCLNDPYNFLQNLKDSNGDSIMAKYADGVGLHLYPTDAPAFTDSKKLLEAYKPVLGDTKKLWLTESGFSLSNENKKSQFQNFIYEISPLNLIGHLYAYTYFSYANESHFDFSKGSGLPVDSAISIFTDNSGATVCLLNMESCPAHPDWNIAGDFFDSANANISNVNKAVCLSRADDFYATCKPKGQVTASFIYAASKELIEKKIVNTNKKTQCEITLDNCPAHPEWNLAGTFIDYANANNSNSDMNACLNRAADYFGACNAKTDVTADYKIDGVSAGKKTVSAKTTVGTECLITLDSCPAHPEWNLAGTFKDAANANNSNSNLNACMSRAADYFGACNSKTDVTADYRVDGVSTGKKTVSPVAEAKTECRITLKNCPKHPEWNLSGTFVDSSNANNSNSNQTACLARASDFYNACAPSGTVNASYFESGVSKGSKTVP